MNTAGGAKNNLFNLYFLALTVSIFLSIWINTRTTVINPDAVCYLLSAQALEAGLSKAMHLCGQAQWPFYSFLIYSGMKIFHLSATAAAYLLNTIFTAISVFTFIRIVQTLGASRRILWFAFFTILLSHNFNAVRVYIIRDHGYWAFYLLSIVCLLKYFRAPSLWGALSWSLSLIVATLFRIEGAMFLILMPFLSWFALETPYKTRLRNFIQLNTVTFLCVFVFLVWQWIQPSNNVHNLGRIYELTQQFQHGIAIAIEHFNTTQNALAHHVLNGDSLRDAGLVLGLVFIAWYCISVMKALSFVYTFLAAYASFNPIHRFAKSDRWVLLSYLGINILFTANFLLQRLFFSKRYLIGLCLVLMLYVPYGLEKIWRQAEISTARRIMSCLVILALLFSATGGIFNFGYSKHYIREAGDWLAQHVSTNDKLYANDFQLMYYSQYFGEDIFSKTPIYTQLQTIANGKWKQYDYLALRLSKQLDRNEQKIIKEIQMTPTKSFQNKRGDRVIIFQNRM